MSGLSGAGRACSEQDSIMRRLLLASSVMIGVLLAGCSDTGGIDDDADTTATTAVGHSTDVLEPSLDTKAAPAGSGQPEGVYGDMANWLCHPALDDSANRCLDDLDLTVVRSDGSTEVVEHRVAEDPPVDCFYLYSTISRDPGYNSDLVASDAEEGRALKNQAARLNSVCEVWAPVYRQTTLSPASGDIGAAVDVVPDLAYQDVLDAWNTYLAQSEADRGVVLVGSSQGAALLSRLIQQEIDHDESVRGRLLSAILLGQSVMVPEGKDVGGDFDNVPLCRRTGETGCVVSFASYRATAPPGSGGRFGGPSYGGQVVACTNPASLTGGQAELHGVYSSSTAQGWWPSWSPWADPTVSPQITTAFYSMPNIVTGECVSEGGYSYLRVTVNGDPSDARADDIGGDLTPEWGLHLIDANLTMDDQVALIEAQADSYEPPHEKEER